MGGRGGVGWEVGVVGGGWGEVSGKFPRNFLENSGKFPENLGRDQLM